MEPPGGIVTVFLIFPLPVTVNPVAPPASVVNKYLDGDAYNPYGPNGCVPDPLLKTPPLGKTIVSPLPVPNMHSVVMKWSGSVASMAMPWAPPSKLL